MRADRLVATLLTLQARGRVTAAQLAEELEVSVATARRDLEALSAAGIPVYPQAGRGWRVAAARRRAHRPQRAHRPRGAGAVPARGAGGIRRPRREGGAAQARARPARELPNGCRRRRGGGRDRRRRMGAPGRRTTRAAAGARGRHRAATTGARAVRRVEPGARRSRGRPVGARAQAGALVPARRGRRRRAHLPRRPDARGRRHRRGRPIGPTTSTSSSCGSG